MLPTQPSQCRQAHSQQCHGASREGWQRRRCGQNASRDGCARVVVAILVDRCREVAGSTGIQLYPTVIDGRGVFVVEAQPKVFADLRCPLIDGVSAASLGKRGLSGADVVAAVQHVIHSACGDALQCQPAS